MPTVNQTVQDVYTDITRKLSPTARLQLAALILNGLTYLNKPIIDDSDSWTEEDQLDITAFALQSFSKPVEDEA